MNKIFIVARREFLTRVQKKTFLLTTIGVPILIFAFYAVIIFMSVKSTSDFKVAVIDQANVFNGKIDEKKVVKLFSVSLMKTPPHSTKN